MDSKRWARSLSRRSLVGSAAVLGTGFIARLRTPCAGCRAIAAEPPAGASTEISQFDPNYLIGTTGNPTLDRALGLATIRLRTFFDVKPGVGLYDDYPPNALTYADSFVPGTKGTVVLGQDLMHRQMSHYDAGGLSVIAILAHEFGHVLQNDMTNDNRLKAASGSRKLIELHADFMAGLYLANLSMEGTISLYGAGRAFHDLGDTEFGNLDHHGTSSERTKSIEFGFRVGNANPDLRPKAAMNESIKYITRTFN